MEKGDRITGVHRPGERRASSSTASRSAKCATPSSRACFFGIWLSPQDLGAEAARWPCSARPAAREQRLADARSRGARRRPAPAWRGGWRNGLRYGVLGLPLAFVALPLYVVLPNHYASAFGVPLALLGAVLLGARLLDAVVDPLIGRWADALFARSARSALARRGAAPRWCWRSAFARCSSRRSQGTAAAAVAGAPRCWP